MEGDNNQPIPPVLPTINPRLTDTPPRGYSTPLPVRNDPPVIVRNHSHPSTPVSLEYDTSCLQEQFHAGGQYLSVPGIERRRGSETNPNIVDNTKILLVDTVVSSLDSTVERLVEAAGRIPSSVMSGEEASPIEDDADNLYEELEALSSKMEANPAEQMELRLIDSFTVRLEAMTDDFESCLKLASSWKRKYKADSNTTLKGEVEEAVRKLKGDFQIYRKSVCDRMEALQPSNMPPPPPGNLPASSNLPEQFLVHLQQEKLELQRKEKEEQAFQQSSKKMQCQAEMSQLLEEVRVRNWTGATDAQIQEAMKSIKDWQARKLKIGSVFQEYTAMMTRWHPSTLEVAGSEYSNMKIEVENFKSDFEVAMDDIKKEDT